MRIEREEALKNLKDTPFYKIKSKRTERTEIEESWMMAIEALEESIKSEEE